MTDVTKIGKLYRRYFSKWIPEYSLFSLIICFLVNSFVYSGSVLIMKNAYHYDFTSGVDKKIPFVKEWISIYVVCYIFWLINYVLICREGKEKWYRFATADLLSRFICAIFFIALPTTNIRPLVLGDDIFSGLVRLVYRLDQPTNLFPSIHCLVSWYCFIGIRKSKKIPLWYKVFSCVFAILVCVSTQFTKQHYLIDIAGGIIIAELCFFITTHTQIYRRIEKAFDRVGRRVFGVTYNNE
ncbi:MAG TPA: phosphatase PAP2 family protein [Lachnospiraceae bacterium]|nr:phosphatase PAP2 family protein [Lachnospiraceae bacterium]